MTGTPKRIRDPRTPSVEQPVKDMERASWSVSPLGPGGHLLCVERNLLQNQGHAEGVHHGTAGAASWPSGRQPGSRSCPEPARARIQHDPLRYTFPACSNARVVAFGCIRSQVGGSRWMIHHDEREARTHHQPVAITCLAEAGREAIAKGTCRRRQPNKSPGRLLRELRPIVSRSRMPSLPTS